jgi:hypothetical protein
MRGATGINVGAAGVEAARTALARAVASGALGPGYAVHRDGDGVAFAGRGGGGPDGGRIAVDGDGRVTWTLQLGGSERVRVARGIGWAAAGSIAGAILFNWLFFVALPVGAALGVVYAATAMVADRRQARRRVEALLASLPVLMDGRGT